MWCSQNPKRLREVFPEEAAAALGLSCAWAQAPLGRALSHLGPYSALSSLGQQTSPT